MLCGACVFAGWADVEAVGVAPVEVRGAAGWAQVVGLLGVWVAHGFPAAVDALEVLEEVGPGC